VKRPNEYRIIYRGTGYMPQVRGGWWPFWRDLAVWERSNELDAEMFVRWHAEDAARRRRKGVVKIVEVEQ
jgi:hypothetical protein